MTYYTCGGDDDDDDDRDISPDKSFSSARLSNGSNLTKDSSSVVRGSSTSTTGSSLFQRSIDRYGFISKRKNMPDSSGNSGTVGSSSSRQLSSSVFPIAECRWNSSISCSPSPDITRTADVDSDEDDDAIDFATLQRHELKWVAMLRDWPDWMHKRFEKIKRRCQKGIPMAVRGRAWRYLSGAVVLEHMNPDKYLEFVQSDKADPKILSEIEKDLHRSFPTHEIFSEEVAAYHLEERQEGKQITEQRQPVSLGKQRSTSDIDVVITAVDAAHTNDPWLLVTASNPTPKRPRGQSDLFDVLKAYSLYNKKVGYCQALAPVASVLLMHLPASQAFWTLVAICDHYMADYYNPGLLRLKRDGAILQSLCARVCPRGHEILVNNQTEPFLYMTEWFMCIFARSLPWASVLRVWDMFFCEGIKVIFKVALAWLSIAFEGIDKAGYIGSSVLYTRRMPSSATQENGQATDGMMHHRGSKSKSAEKDRTLTTGRHPTSTCSFTIDHQCDVLLLIKSVPHSALTPKKLLDRMKKLPISERQFVHTSRKVSKEMTDDFETVDS